MKRQSEHSDSVAAKDDDELSDYEEASGRAIRARTRLIVEGYSNLALIAILFAGIQAQLVSVTNEHNDSPLEVATNAVFFGGLMFSVFTAVLAVLSGRWFSILREDDSDYLSSRWLHQDTRSSDVEKAMQKGGKANGTGGKTRKGKRKPNLDKYLDFQIESMKSNLEKLKEQHRKRTRRRQASLSNAQSLGASQGEGQSNGQNAGAELGKDSDEFNPSVFDTEHIIQLLEKERRPLEYNKESNEGSGSATKRSKWERFRDGCLWFREWVLSFVLISPIVMACPAFILFCAGILMLVWNKQPRSVAIFTSVTISVCILLFTGFFVKHRRKHVIKKLYLGRPSW